MFFMLCIGVYISMLPLDIWCMIYVVEIMDIGVFMFYSLYFYFV